MSVDLLVLFRSAASKDDAKQVGEEYSRLVQTLRNGGLQATGKKGDKQGRLIVPIHCPEQKVADLARDDAARAFVHGLTSSQTALDSGLNLSPAERNRLIYLYVCSSKSDGGLGITPGASGWPRVESIMLLHDQAWNDKWIKKWSTSLDVEASLDQLRAQFGESVAMYFAFLSLYLRSLIVPSALGVLAYFSLGAFSSLYSIAIVAWSLIFVEWWTIAERKLSVRWGVRGASNGEVLRAEYVEAGDVWWKRELKTIASIPVIAVYALLLTALMTSIFVFEAFVTQLYNGPGKEHIGLAPTIAFVILVPRLLSFYHAHAVRLTEWENHPRQSSYDRSLTLKSFALAAIVAYGGLMLSAFIYVPFGSQIMRFVQVYLSGPVAETGSEKATTFFKVDQTGAQGETLIQGLKGERLRNQVFAYTVTNQVINFVQEVVVPWVTEKAQGIKANKLSKKKRVEWEDEKSVSKMSKEDRELLDAARTEASLPDYQLFGDYSEMITQFGYVVVWSTCWPLAPLMALINNWIELRSDAFKIAKLGRRPLPSRTDSIGAWLNALSFLAWLGALINAALVYLFNPSTGRFAFTHTSNTTSFTSTLLNGNATETAAYPTATNEPSITTGGSHFLDALHGSGSSTMLTALVIALLASHGYIVLRAVVRHVLERALWFGSKEALIVEQRDREAREARVRSAAESGVAPRVQNVDGTSGAASATLLASEGFWEDQGLQEINSAAKTE